MSTTECDREQGTTMKRKYWLIVLAVLGYSDKCRSRAMAAGFRLVIIRTRPHIGRGPGETVAWWKSKDNKTD